MTTTSSKPKIIVLVNSMSGGGSERVALELCHYFDAQGHTVTLLLLNRRGEYLEQINSSVIIKSVSTLFARTGIFGRILAVWWILLNDSSQFILSIGEWPNVIAPMSNLFLFKRKRMVIAEHSTKTIINSPQNYGRSKLDMRLGRWSYKLSNLVIAVSEEVRKSLKHAIPQLKEVTVINNPINIEEIQSRGAASVEHPWFDQRTCPVLISVGSLKPLKDHGCMLRAFKLASDQKDMKLLIMGDGPERQNISGLIEELGLTQKVMLLPFQANPFKYMTKSDLFIHSSTYEGFPMVFAEAMACGLPIVTTDCNVPKELFEKNKSTRVVPISDHQSLAAGVVELLNEPHDKQHIRSSVEYLDVNVIGLRYQSSIFQNTPGS